MIMRKALLFLLFFVATEVAGQTLPPIPERLVNLDCTNKRTDEVLRDIAAQGKFEFAWDARLFDPAKPVTLQANQVTVRRAIYLLFGNEIAFRVKGNYLVLMAAPVPLAVAPQPVKKMEFTLSGYIIDSATYVIPFASVYDSVSLSGTLSSHYGFYELNIPAGTEPVRIKVSREKYIDTFIVVVPSSNQTVDVVMRKIPPPVVHVPITVDSVTIQPDTLAEIHKRRIDKIPFLDSLIGFEQIMQTRNLKETLRSTGQISLLPFVSTNGMMTGAVSNKYSFNLLGGFTGGTSVAELGGVFNIDRGDVQFVQVAGAFNLVEGNARGLQLSGAANVNFGKMNGLQLTGASNFLFDSLNGVQLAGAGNFCDSHVKGFQVAGAANVASNNVDGMQISGVLNVCLDTMRGVQIGVVNVAKNVKGIQLGIMNYANSCNDGVPVGLISIVAHGIHEMEIASSERGYTTLSVRTGTPKFYNILSFGCDPEFPEQTLWSFGYGAGHRFSIHPEFDVAIDLIAHHVNQGSIAAYTNEWIQLSFTAEWRPVHAFAIAAGPVANYYISGGQENHLSRFGQTPVYSGMPAEGFRDVAWVGATFSLRFF